MTVRSLSESVSMVDDGDVVAFGGKTLHRAPMAMVRELVRHEVADLTLIGLAKSMDVDLLCGLNRVEAVHYGYVGFEWLGLAPNFRRAVETGRVVPLEGTCYTVASMFRGAKRGVPFVPVAGLENSDLPDVNEDFLSTVECPFTGETVSAVRTVTPDVAVIHATEADPVGNVRIEGADLTESLVVRAADTVIVTAERIVDTASFESAPDRTTVPGFLVDAVVEAPYGAHPCSCPGEYEYDTEHLREYLKRSSTDELDDYVQTYLGEDEADYRERAIGDRTDAIAWDGSTTPTTIAESEP